MRTKGLRRQRRHRTIRKKVQGSAERPRLCVFRSSLHIYAQLIDDGSGRTLVSASTLDNEFKGRADGSGGSVEVAREVGKLIGQRASAAGHKEVVFDRGGYPYQGRVRALAEGAREAGLEL